MSMPQAARVGEASTPVEVRFGTPAPQRRVTVFFRFILAFPQLLIVGVIGYAAYVVVFLGWFAALVTGRLPAGFARFLTGYIRWYTRVLSYFYLVTDQYPPFTMDLDPLYPVDVAVTTGRLNRLSVLFRIVLVIPAAVVVAAVGFGWQILSFFFWIITVVKGEMPDSIFGATAAVLRYQTRFVAYFSMVTSVYPGGLLGDTGPQGQRVDARVSGTPYTPPWPGGWPATQTTAWSGPPGATAAPLPPAPLPPPPLLPPSGPGTGVTPEPAPVPPAAGDTPLPPLLPPPPAAPTAPAGAPGSPPSFPPPPVPPAPPAATAPTGATVFPPSVTPPPPSTGPTAPTGATVFPGPPPPDPSSIDPGPGRFWPLWLSRPARTLTVVLIVLGAVGMVAYAALFGTAVHVTSLQSTVAAGEVRSAYSTVGAASQAYASSVKQCTSSSSSDTEFLQCVSQATSTLAGAFTQYQDALSGISYPSSALAESNAAIAAAGDAVKQLTVLAGAPNLTAYQNLSASPGFRASLDAVDSTYSQLMSSLNGG